MGSSLGSNEYLTDHIIFSTLWELESNKRRYLLCEHSPLNRRVESTLFEIHNVLLFYLVFRVYGAVRRGHIFPFWNTQCSRSFRLLIEVV